MRVVVLDDNVGPWLERDARLAAGGVDVIRVTSNAEAAAALPDADAFVGVYFPADLAAAARDDLRLLQVTAAGVDHVDLASVPASAHVANAYGHERSIAEHVVMTTLALRRHLRWSDAELREGRWRSRLVDVEAPAFSTLRGARLGIVGWGRIGREVATIGAAFGMESRAVSRTARDRPDELVADVGTYDDLVELARDSDVLVLACPLTDRTRHLVDADVLRALGPDGLLVNVARGGVVDVEALADALERGEVGGAALDVWDVPAGTAPVADARLLARDDVVMTPHYSASALDTYRDRAAQVADNLLAVAGGGLPSTLVREGVR